MIDLVYKGERNVTNRGIIFDGDDTLWETAEAYDDAKLQFCSMLVEEGFSSSEILTTLEDIDVANVQNMGFSKDRFYTSMRSTYRILCARHKASINDQTETDIQRVGYGVFTAEVKPSNSVREVLRKSLKAGYKLILATKGDSNIQRAKIKQSGLSPFFSAVYVLENKSDLTFRRIAEECNLDTLHSWVVGDSLRSDINPALRAGFNAIWIKKETWAYERDSPGSSERFYEVPHLRDCLKIVCPE